MKRWLLLFALLPQWALATVVTVSWTNPTAYTDKSVMPGTDIGSTTVQYGTCSTTTPLAVATVAGTFTAQGGTTHAQSPDLPAGAYCFQAVTNSLCCGPSDPSVAAQDVITRPGVPVVSGTTNQVVTTSTTAFTLVKQHDAQLMLAVGSVPLGTACITDEGALSHGVFYTAVPKVSVTLSGTVSPDIVYALCGS